MGKIDNRPAFALLDGKELKEIISMKGAADGEEEQLPTPCYIIEELQLKKNGEVLAGVSQRTGCKILLAQKAFSNFNLYPLLSDYLAGTEASGLYEARLGAEEMPGKKFMYFAEPIGMRNLLSCYSMQTILCLIQCISLQNSGSGQRQQERASGSASIRNAPPRKVMPFMTHVHRAAALA